MRKSKGTAPPTDDFEPAEVQASPEEGGQVSPEDRGGPDLERMQQVAQGNLLSHLSYMGELAEQREDARQRLRALDRQFREARERRFELVQHVEQLGAPLPPLRKG